MKLIIKKIQDFEDFRSPIMKKIRETVSFLPRKLILTDKNNRKSFNFTKKIIQRKKMK